MNVSDSSPDLLLERVFQTSLNGLLVCRAIRDNTGQVIDFQVVSCNECAVAMAGILRENMLNCSMLTIDPDGHKSGIFDTYRQVVETGLPTHIEHYWAGANTWMEQSLARLGDDEVLASWVNITPRKQAEQERQQQTDLLQAILDNTESGIAVMESVRDAGGTPVDFRFTHLNPAAERIALRTKGTLIGELYSVAWPESQTNGVLNWHVQVAATGVPFKINGIGLPVGTYKGWYNVRIRPFGDGVIATFMDVTALKQAELATQQQAELLRSVLDNSLNPIIAFTAIRDGETGQVTDFRYAAQNEANRLKMKCSDADVIGHTMIEYVPQVMSTGLFDRYVQVLQTGQPDRFEQEHRAGWFEIFVSRWGDGIVLTLVDITSSKNHRQQVEQINLELLNANDNLRQFAYVASHDLQEPLRKIMAFSDILQAQFSPQLDAVGQDIIGRMQAATVRMSTLIKDVLAYSRISTHREPFQPISLDQLLTDACHEYQTDFAEANAQIKIDDPLPTVLGDRTQLRYLFGNLVANALKFRSDQPLLIRLRCQTIVGVDGPSVLNPAGTYYEISLTDNGIGFDMKYADRIFQVFQRLHTRQQYGGTGVGLAICKRVVENHRGAISAISQPGQGATFRVYLPK